MADLENEITELIIRIARRQRQRGDFRNGGVDLGGLTPHQARIVGYIAGRESTGVIAREISDLTGARPASVSALVNGLEADGWIQRQPDPSDSRRKILRVTAKGRNLVERYEAHAHAESRLDLSNLTIEQRKQLKSLLGAIDQLATD